MGSMLLAASSPVVGSFISCAALRLCERRSWAEACRQSPPWSLVEPAAVAVAAVPLLLFDGWRAAAGCGLGWALLLLVIVEARRHILPHELTMPLLAAGLALAASYQPDALADRALAAGLGWLGLSLAAAWARRRGWGGVGGGEARLVAAAGAWVGPLGLPWVVLPAALACWAARRWRVPFGACLAASLFGVWTCLS